MGDGNKRFIISGCVTASLAIIGFGFKWAFPDMIVPFEWALGMIGVGVASLGATAYFGYRWLWPKKAEPPSVGTFGYDDHQPDPVPEAIARELSHDPDGSEAIRKNELAAKRARARSEVQVGTRDVSLPEALAYAELGQWEKSFLDAVSVDENEVSEQLERFQQLAHDGNLNVWGKRTENGVFQLISKDHWIDHQVEWFDLLRGKARTENVRHTQAEPYSELMVSKAEFEREWPHAQE